MADTVLVHPNRDKASSQTLGIVFILLVVGAALILIVTLGGWEHLEAQPISFAWAAVYLVIAWQVARWNRECCPSRPRSRSCSR